MITKFYKSKYYGGKKSPPTARSSHSEVFCQKGLLKDFATCARACFLINLQASPCEFCESFRNTFFKDKLRRLLLSYRWLLRLQLLLSCFLLQASILHNKLLLHLWKELIKEINMCIAGILVNVFNIYFTANWHINISVVGIVWSIISSLNNSDSISL